MTLRFAPLLLLASAFAQDSVPALNPFEKEFEQTMSHVTLAGHFTHEGSNGMTDEKYTIEKVTKIKDDLWRFDTRVQYGGTDVKMPISLHVKWAGDTPVITMTDETIPGLGSFSARIVIYHGQYAGMWSHSKGRGGQMFGKIVKAGE